MGFFNAIVKDFFDRINYSIYQNDKKKASSKAYKQIGKEIQIAKSKGKTINGSMRYKKNYSAINDKNKANFDRRAKFIDRS